MMLLVHGGTCRQVRGALRPLPYLGSVPEARAQRQGQSRDLSRLVPDHPGHAYHLRLASLRLCLCMLLPYWRRSVYPVIVAASPNSVYC